MHEATYEPPKPLDMDGTGNRPGGSAPPSGRREQNQKQGVVLPPCGKEIKVPRGQRIHPPEGNSWGKKRVCKVPTVSEVSVLRGKPHFPKMPIYMISTIYDRGHSWEWVQDREDNSRVRPQMCASARGSRGW